MHRITKLTVAFLFLLHLSSFSQKRIIVAKDGSAAFTSIQDALESMPAGGKDPCIIFIKNGIYKEKIYIVNDNITLTGESREYVILDFEQARDVWRCDYADDWGVATVNLRGSGITLENLTISNSYGFKHETITIENCKNDSNKTKLVRKDGHQMALRSFATTKLIVKNCLLKAYGGDTVSPWNVEEGMFYFKDCTMEGGVDFYCPRGWAYAENCTFIAHSGPASIWHDGSKNKDSKTVLSNCRFEGFDEFKLGRYHRDAQFYLLNCSFAKNMADADIYLVPTANVIQWGRRIYFYNCHRDGGKDFTWYANNLQTAEGNPAAKEISAKWVFAGKWDPEAK